MKRTGCWLAGLVLLLACQVQAGVSKALLDIHERMYLEQDGRGIFTDAVVYQPAFVSEFYEQSEFQPVWTDADYAREMLELLRASEWEGLDPGDYHHPELLRLIDEYADPWSDKDYLRAQAEVLLTDGILLYARHLLEGKVDPRGIDASWNYTRRDFDSAEVAAALLQAISERRVAQTLDSLKPSVPFYQLMRESLRHYRALAADARFQPVPDDRVLRKGDNHANVAALRRRLAEMSYLSRAGGSHSFDAELDRAVRQLQRDHGLGVDGIVGAQSYRVLNLSFSERVDILRINMDRLRWLTQDLSDDFLVTNIAGFELYYIRHGAPVWETPVMVGKISTRTPIFHAPLKYLEFNPTWNPPRSIIGRSLLPSFKKDPGYAARKGYRFLDNAGRSIDPADIDFNRYSAGSFPYRVVQMPGPDNAMGQVKFMFPNRHAVYLHDTPSRALFSRQQRAFSAGCIRVKNPLELARVLLDDPANWSGDQIRALVDSGEPRQVVHIQRDIDVMLMYWTASPTPSGMIQFHEDIYQLDPPSLAALDAPPEPVPFVPR